MILMSIKLPRQKRIQQQLLNKLSIKKPRWFRALGWLNRLPGTLNRRRRRRGSQRKLRLDQLSDHQLKDIGLTRGLPEANLAHWHPSVQYSEAQIRHKALKDLQFDLIRHLPRDT